MDILKTREQLRSCSIYDLPLRVTFYARVSTEKDAQLNSLDNQISFYSNMIKKNPNWQYVEGYIDEGLSAISTEKRENFHRMVTDGENGEFDMIITKEISRFARNTLDSIRFTRELLHFGVAVFFQNDNINTLDEDSELRLTIMSSIAQDELRKLSSRIKFGHQQAIKDHVVLGNSRIFGYRKDNKRLVIDEDEAKMVRELFELYATNEYSMKQIENIFWEKGYRNHNGNKIAHTTMSGMISNPKYKGYYVGNKVKVVDMFTKKQKFLPPEDWFMFKDETGEIVPAIVSEELWDKANDVLERRSKDVKNRQGKCNHGNLLTGKLFCTDCGATYYRRDAKDRQGNKNSKWICSGKIKNGADSCKSFPIYESDVVPILLEVFKETSCDVEELINQYVEMYKSLSQPEEVGRRLDELKKKMDLEQKKKSKLLGYNVSGQISDRDFISLTKQCSNEIALCEKEISALENEMQTRNDFKKRIEEMRRTLKRASEDANSGVINHSFVEKYIDKIYVTPIDETHMEMKIKLFTNETTTKYLENLRVRTGHTFNLIMDEPEDPDDSSAHDYPFESTGEELYEIVSITPAKLYYTKADITDSYVYDGKTYYTVQPDVSGTKITIKDTKTGKLYTTVLDGTEFMDVYSSTVSSLTKPNQVLRVDFVADVDDCFGITTPTGYNKNVQFSFDVYFNHQSTNDTATKDNATKNTVMNDNGSVPTGSPITTMLFTLSAVIAGGALFLSYRKKFEK